MSSISLHRTTLIFQKQIRSAFQEIYERLRFQQRSTLPEVSLISSSHDELMSHNTCQVSNTRINLLNGQLHALREALNNYGNIAVL